MCKMAPLIGKEMTEKIFLDRYIALCKDKEFYTRKICASHFGKLCSAVGRKTLFRKLVGTSPFFFFFKIDISNWYILFKQILNTFFFFLLSHSSRYLSICVAIQCGVSEKRAWTLWCQFRAVWLFNTVDYYWQIFLPRILTTIRNGCECLPFKF